MRSNATTRGRQLSGGLGIRDTAADRDGDLALVLRMVAKLGGEAGLTPALERRFQELALGLSNQEIAVEHGITVNTVKTQVRTLLRILDLDCRHEIVHAVRGAQARLQERMPCQQVEALLRLTLERV